MSAATARTSWKRSCSYRLCVNPRPVLAMPARASLQRTRSCRVGRRPSASPLLINWRGYCRENVVSYRRERLFVGDLLAVRAPDVERVDRLRAHRLDLRRPDVETVAGERRGDAIQHTVAILRVYIDDGGGGRHLVVERHGLPNRTRALRDSARVRTGALLDCRRHVECTVEHAREVGDDLRPADVALERALDEELLEGRAVLVGVHRGGHDV